MNIKILVNAAQHIIYSNEGNYASVNPNDNGAVSIGKVQWHANRALSLLRKIVYSDRNEATKILGETLYHEIVTSTDWTKRKFTKEEADRISRLLKTDQSIAIQDKQSTTDVTAYINHGMNLGIIDGKTLIYYADVENQGGSKTSSRIGNAAIKKTGNVQKVNLEIYHACALSDSVMKKHSARRIIVYDKCKALDLSEKPASNPYSQPKSIVKKGDYGTSVSWVQWELIQSGIKSAVIKGITKTLNVDGDFGSITEVGVKQFQKQYKLKADGIVGPKTIKAFLEAK